MSFTGRDLGLALSEDVGDAPRCGTRLMTPPTRRAWRQRSPSSISRAKCCRIGRARRPSGTKRTRTKASSSRGAGKPPRPPSEHFLSGLDAAPDGAPPRARRSSRRKWSRRRSTTRAATTRMTRAAAARRSPSPMTRVRTRSRAVARSSGSRLRRKQLEETEEPAEQNEEGPEHEEEEGEEESSSEYETGSEDEVAEPTERLKPIFVPKGRRETVTAAEQQAAEEAAKETKRQLQAEERKRETRDLVAETIRREEEQNEVHLDGNGSEADMPDDADVDEDSPEFEIEFEVWKTRELARRRRDASERELMQKDQEETERRRRLTDEERLAEDRAAGKLNAAAPGKPKWKFLQKYYHKGAFYMDDESLVTRDATGKEDVRKREYDAPTLEDKYDKSAMPAVMQVKKFGFAGRTKYTHLNDQDTTAKDNPMNGWMNRKPRGGLQAGGYG